MSIFDGRHAAIAPMRIWVYPRGSDVSPSVHAHVFAGIWQTETRNASGQLIPLGKLTLQVATTTKGTAAVKFYSGGTANCPASTTYYTGAYIDGADAGQIAGCTNASGTLLTAWYRSGAGPQHGTIKININPQHLTAFTGTYQEESGPGTVGTYDGTK
jgi:hypothetical protein